LGKWLMAISAQALLQGIRRSDPAKVNVDWFYFHLGPSLNPPDFRHPAFAG